MSRKDNLFKHVPVNPVPRNMFDLSHEVKMSGKFAYLYPVLAVETLPGDTFREQMTVFMRTAPLLAPVMHRVDVKSHFFFVPYRLLSDHWEDFITGGQDGLQAVTLPYIRPTEMSSDIGNNYMQKGSLWDYLGLPVLEGAPPAAFTSENISALPFRAYLKIWNDWYRDPNFDDEIDLQLSVQGNVTLTEADQYFLRTKAWDKDYFTAALPWPQRGAEVLMPIEGNASVNYLNPATVERQDNGVINAGEHLITGSNGVSGAASIRIDGVTDDEVILRNIESVDVDGISTTINDLRLALAMQKWLENNARGGGRYIDQILAHYNQRVPDYRLQRSEYLGGGSQPITISEVLSTAESVDVPVGDMAGHGISIGKTNGFTYRCQEHGIIIGIVSVVPKPAYSQGIHRMWSKFGKFDVAFPELANIGEQEIQNKEVFFSFDDADEIENNEGFGYIPRYAEYKFMNDRIAGDFRDTLAHWHLGRMFAQRPILNEQFTTMAENATVREESYRRIFAVQDGTDYLWFQLFHRLTAKRPLPYFGVPKLG